MEVWTCEMLRNVAHNQSSFAKAKQHQHIPDILEAVKAAAVPEVQQALSPHLAKLQRQAETQQHFQVGWDVGEALKFEEL